MTFAIIESNSAFYALELEDWAAARRHLQESIRISAERGAEEQRNGPRWIQLARAQGRLGAIEEGRQSLERGERLMRALYGDDEARKWRYLGRAAQAALALGDAQRGAARFREAIDLQRRHGEPDAAFYENLGRLAEVLHEIDSQDAEVDALLAEALAEGALKGSAQEFRHRRRFEDLVAQRRSQ